MADARYIEALRPYYAKELEFLTALGDEFARAYPAIARQLRLRPDPTDPHVERLIQAVAFLAARVRRKLDDEFPELTSAFFNVVYPHYLLPIPSMSIVQFFLDQKEGKVTSGYPIKRGTELSSTHKLQGTECRFQTSYPVTLWPVEVREARFDGSYLRDSGQQAESVLKLSLLCHDGASFSEFDESSFTHLRFFLDGESAQVYSLYELLLNNVAHVQLRPEGSHERISPITLSPQQVSAVGFHPEEAVLPYTARSFAGYRLLQEYFVFPEKFLFFDLHGVNTVVHAQGARTLDILFFLKKKPLFEQISAETFRLGCTPIINLFDFAVDSIRFAQLHPEYRVVPDAAKPHVYEAYTIQSVKGTPKDASDEVIFHSFYSVKHAIESQKQEAFWYAARRPSRQYEGTDLFLSLVDPSLRPYDGQGRSMDGASSGAPIREYETVSLKATCMNRGLPGDFPLPNHNIPSKKEESDFQPVEKSGAPALNRYLRTPTKPLHPRLDGELQWRLISHLSLNYLSLFEGGREPFQEILKLYSFSQSPAVQQQIAGIDQIKAEWTVYPYPFVNRYSSREDEALPSWKGFCRGLQVTLTFNEDLYVGSSVFLFASVLERFLGLYTSINSFTRVIATTRRRVEDKKEHLKKWPPRAGEQILL